MAVVRGVFGALLWVAQVLIGALCGALVVAVPVRFDLLPEPVSPIFYFIPAGVIGGIAGAAIVVVRLRQTGRAGALAELDSILQLIELDASQRAAGFHNTITQDDIPILNARIREIATRLPELEDLRTHPDPLQVLRDRLRR